MPRQKVKYTPMQEAFRHEQQRLRRAISREFRETGVEIDKSLIPEMPKRVTKKQLEKIKSIKPKELREKTIFVDEETGEIISYNEVKRRWKEEQKYTPPVPPFEYSHNVINFFRASYSQYSSQFQYNMNRWLDSLIATYGESAVAEMLIKGAHDGVIVTYKMAYSETLLSEFQAAMLEYLQMPSDIKADIMSGMEYETGYEEPE